MVLTPQIQPISEMARDHKALLQRIEAGPVFLSQRGRIAAVVVSPDDWDELAISLERLQDAVDVLEATIALHRAGDNPEDADVDELRKWATKNT